MNGFKINKSMFIEPLHLPPSAWTGHIPFAAWLVEELKPKIFVELGTHHGASYLGFCQAVRENGLETKSFAVDTWQGDEHAGTYDDVVFDMLNLYHKDRYAGFSQLLRMTFDQALPNFGDGSVDLLHIDGLHTYDAVKHDFESWLPKVSSRGVVLFHDTMVRERKFGVWKLWEELTGRYPSFEFQHMHGLGVLLVGTEIPDGVQRMASLATSEDRVSILRLFESLAARIEYKTRSEELQNTVAERDRLVISRDQAIQQIELRNELELARLDKEIVSREQALQQIREHMEQAVARLNEQLFEERERTNSQSAQVAIGMAERADLRNSLEEFRERLARAQVQSDAYASELRIMFGSRSWKVTAPIRKLMSLLRTRKQ